MEKEFLKLFKQKQKAYEELKKYVLSKTPVIGEKKLKDLLNKERIASCNFNNFLSKKYIDPSASK